MKEIGKERERGRERERERGGTTVDVVGEEERECERAYQEL